MEVFLRKIACFLSALMTVVLMESAITTQGFVIVILGMLELTVL
jgi:hypothetical protein